MKTVLLLEKPPAAVITNGLSTPEEMATALLAMNKVMQGLSKRFKLELKLEDGSNSTWREQLKENSKRKQKIERTEEKKRKRLALKEQKAVDRKRQEWLEQNCQADIADEEKNIDNVSTEKGWEVEEIDVPILKEVEKEEANDKSLLIPKTLKSRSRESKNLSNIQNDKPKKKQKMESIIKEVTEFDVNSSVEEEIEPEKVQERLISDEELEDDAAETHVVDSFFVTETGENYLSTAVTTNRNRGDLSDEENEKDLHMIRLNSSKKYTDMRERKQQRNDKYHQGQSKWNDGKYSQNQSKWNNEKQPQRQNRRNDEITKQNGWTGQKDRKTQNGSMKPKWEKTNSNTPKPSFSSNTNIDEKLHPSWAAKQKLKPVITSFQGKKITFGDDSVKEIRNSVAPMVQKSQTTSSDSLHPSWAAKQKLKPVITAFQGKKISFDNDD